MVDGRVMPIGRPAPIVDGTSATKLTHEDSVPISPSDELRVVLAVKRARQGNLPLNTFACCCCSCLRSRKFMFHDWVFQHQHYKQLTRLASTLCVPIAQSRALRR